MPKQLICQLLVALLPLHLLAAEPGRAPAAAPRTSSPSPQALPARALLLELRQIDGAQSGYVVGTQPSTPLLVPQQMQAVNGKPARFSLGQTQMLQWVQSVSAGGTLSGPSVNQALIRVEAGQSLSVLPRWPGGTQAVEVEIELQSQHVAERVGTDLPAQTHSQLASTVKLPLGQWTTIASTGAEAPRGVYSSAGSASTRRLFQLRVTAP